MKRIISTFISALFAIGMAQAQYNQATDTYTLQDADVTVVNGVITACSTKASDWGTGKLIIPETLDGQMVTAIRDGSDYSDGVFRYKDITDIQFPETLDSIGDYSFRENRIVNLVIPDHVKYLGDHAFYYVYSIQTLVLSQNLDTIRACTFDHAQIKTITIPKNVRCFTGRYGLSGSRSLKTVIFEEGSRLTTIGEKTFADDSISNIVIPDSVSYIGESAFISNNISNITIPNRVSYIGKDAFNCNPVKSITLPSPVIKEGYMFTGWKDQNGNAVTKITDFTLAYEAQFIQTSVSYNVISGSVAIDNTTGFSFNITGDTTIENTITSNRSFFYYIEKGQSITITPRKEGYTFSPASKTIDNIQADILDLNFTATRIHYTVSGTISIDNTSKLTLKISGDTLAIKTISTDGGFNFNLSSGKSVTITPVKQGYVFTPPSITINSIQASASGKNFTASPVTAINDIAGDMVTVFPNPAKDLLSVQSVTLLYAIELFDMKGMLLIKRKPQGDNTVIDVKDLPQGMYILKVKTEARVIERNVVKE